MLSLFLLIAKSESERDSLVQKYKKYDERNFLTSYRIHKVYVGKHFIESKKNSKPKMKQILSNL